MLGQISLPLPQLLAQSGSPSVPLSPALILVLCVIAGIGTVLLLPSRREGSMRKIGGAMVLAMLLIFAAVLVRMSAGSAGDNTANGLGIYFWIFAGIALFGAIRVVTHPRPVYSALYFVLTVFASAGLFLLLWAEFMAAALILIYAGAILVTYVFVIMLAAEATPTAGGLAKLGEYDKVSRDPLIAAAVGFATMGVMLFVIFDKAQALASPPITSVVTMSPQDAANLTDAQKLLIRTTNSPAPLTESHPQKWDFGSGLHTALDWSAWNASASGSSEARSRDPQAPIVSGSTQELGVYLFEHHLVNVELAGLLLTVSMIGAIVIARRKVVGDSGRLDAGQAGRNVMVAPMTPINDNPHSIPVTGTMDARQKAYPET